MRLGVCMSAFRDEALPDVLRWAGGAGFECVEISCAPVRGPAGWFDGPDLRLAGLDGPSRDALGAALDGSGLKAAALEWDGDLMDADPAAARAAAEQAPGVIEAAATLGVPVVAIRLGRDPAMSLGDTIAEFARRAAPLAAQAESSGVRLAVANDPECGRHFEDMPGAAAFAPELWEKLFTHLRSRAVGLALDPAPLVWLGVDPIAAMTDYFEKVFHLRARDVEVLDLARQDCSVLRPGSGWWRYRLPGLGQIDWRRLIDRLHELSYDGAIAVRHDDPVWQGSPDRMKTGLGLARRHLVQFMP